MVYDAYTGNFLFNATNVPTGTSEVGPNGEYLIYTFTNYGNTTNPNWYYDQMELNKTMDLRQHTISCNNS